MLGLVSVDHDPRDAQCAGRVQRNNSTPPMAGFSYRRDRPRAAAALSVSRRRLASFGWRKGLGPPALSRPHRWTTGDGAGARPI
jgi:hypothetical protein